MAQKLDQVTRKINRRKWKVMKSIVVSLLVLGLAVAQVEAMDFGLAENSLSVFRAISYREYVHQGSYYWETGVNQDD